MSSTNRGAERQANDYYVTPILAIRTFLREFARDAELELGIMPQLLHASKILDPCAGGDAEHPMSYPEAIRQEWGLDISQSTIDVREDSLAAHKQDYLATEVAKRALIISNPPFSLAQPFVEKALADVEVGGLVVMLVRLNFFGSQKRQAWWREHMPLWSYVHAERMSFATRRSAELAGRPYKPGETDSIEYAHLVWCRGVKPRWVHQRVI